MWIVAVSFWPVFIHSPFLMAYYYFAYYSLLIVYSKRHYSPLLTIYIRSAHVVTWFNFWLCIAWPVSLGIVLGILCIGYCRTYIDYAIWIRQGGLKKQSNNIFASLPSLSTIIVEWNYHLVKGRERGQFLSTL